MARANIDVEERVSLIKGLPLSLQHLFAMFGGTILVPTLLGIDPSTVLMFNGMATVFYLICCKGKIPAYLGSSFAFIAPVLALQTIHGHDAGYSMALSGFFAGGVLTLIVGLVIMKIGSEWIKYVFPDAAIGAIIAVIGLGLAPNAAKMAGLTAEVADANTIIVSMTTLAVTVFGYVFFKGFLAIIPILIGILTGYALSACLGMIDFSIVANAPWLRLPTFYKPTWDQTAILALLPVALVSIAEHVGDLTVISSIIERPILKQPGLGRSMSATGFSITISSLFGATPQTTYSENVGVLAISRVFSVWIVGGAAVLSFLLSFLGKFAAIIQTIPSAVMGGVSLLLFGVIATSGIRTIIEKNINYDNPRNTVITSLVLLVGVSGAKVHLFGAEFQGMALSTIVSLILGLSFSVLDKIFCRKAKAQDKAA
mgnify:CR=1 FL=1